MGSRDRRPRVVHPGRPELGTGRVGEIFEGKPPVAQVYWPDPDKYGFYLVTDLRRVRIDGSVEPVASEN